MPGTENIRRAVQSVRNRVQRDNGYINSELRTKYVLIDPLLHALGWDTADPARVKMEFRSSEAGGIPDYALFKQSPERLVGLIEAKSLQPEQIPRLRERARRQDQNVISAFEALRSPATHKPQAGRGEVLFDEETWATLKKANEEQLQAYVQELEMRAGVRGPDQRGRLVGIRPGEIPARGRLSGARKCAGLRDQRPLRQSGQDSTDTGRHPL